MSAVYYVIIIKFSIFFTSFVLSKSIDTQQHVKSETSATNILEPKLCKKSTNLQIERPPTFNVSAMTPNATASKTQKLMDCIVAEIQMEIAKSGTDEENAHLTNLLHKLNMVKRILDVIKLNKKGFLKHNGPEAQVIDQETFTLWESIKSQSSIIHFFNFS